MARKTGLSADDRELLHAAIRVERSQDVYLSQWQLAQSVFGTLDERQPYDENAERILRSIALDGIYGQVAVVLKEPKVEVTYSRADGSRDHVTLPAIVGVATGDPANPYVQLPFLGLEWDRFEQYCIREIENAHRQIRKAEALQRILALRALYPQTLTPAEAIRVAGLDLDDLDLFDIG